MSQGQMLSPSLAACRLLVVSHTPHYRDPDGRLTAFGPTARELDHLAGQVAHLTHLAPLWPGPAPGSALPYRATNLEFLALPPSGGATGWAKLRILLGAPHFWWLLTRAVSAADLVHVRAPANQALLAMMAWRWLPRRPWWVKYAGNWQPAEAEAWSYRWQRGWCAEPRPGVRVTVNGRWPDQPHQIVTFRNPCLEAAELAEGAGYAANKTWATPIRLLYVGRLEEPKGAPRAVEILRSLRARGLDAHLDLIGDGPARPQLAALAAGGDFGDALVVHGELPRPALATFYARAHFLVLPTRSSEGWPKVLAEAMAYGALPLAGAISSIPQILGELGLGAALPPLEPAAFADAIARYGENPDRFHEESRRAAAAARQFTYDRYLADVNQLFAELLPQVPQRRSRGST